MGEVHEGKYGAHRSRNNIKWVINQYVNCWPTIIEDCFWYAKGCEECQNYGNIQWVPVNELHSIIRPWPFKGWIVDIIGNVHPPSSKRHSFILVVKNYFTKWADMSIWYSINHYYISRNHVYRRKKLWHFYSSLELSWFILHLIMHELRQLIKSWVIWLIKFWKKNLQNDMKHYPMSYGHAEIHDVKLLVLHHFG